ncbi:VanZ family protein [Planococcus versutus]|uniref:VanZ family protein n=1 Tax=Planococcus versutus TaxID=1302659 RepID=A0A1B1S343_9BACL|nr:VanZ family protein [Planococcus versutus]ANU27608.1 VanZ family protein [Planococcus versutus]
MIAYKRMSWIAVFAWMAVIFYLSHQPGSASSNLSSGIVAGLLDFINQLAPEIDLDVEVFHTFIRKNAHFIAYFILSLVSLNAWTSSGFRGGARVLLSLATTVLFAITDEIHQLFIDGRSGEVRDVLIDSAGASLGVLLYLVFGKALHWSKKADNSRKR